MLFDFFVGLCLLFLEHLFSTLDAGIGNPGCNQPYCPYGIIISRYDIIDFIRITVGINNRNNRYIETFSLTHCNCLIFRINNKDSAWDPVHGPDPAKIVVKLYPFMLKFQSLLFGKQIYGSIIHYIVKMVKTIYTLFNGMKICQHSTQPPVTHIKHFASISLFINRIPGLLFGTDKKNRFAVCDNLGYKIICCFKHANSFLEIDNINTVPCSEDVWFHFWIPALCLMPKMYPSFKKLPHCKISHSFSLSLNRFFPSPPSSLFPTLKKMKAPGNRSKGV